MFDLEKGCRSGLWSFRRKKRVTDYMVEQASDAIYVIDLEGNFLDVNNKICQMTGYTHEELLAMNVEGIIDREELEKDPPLHGQAGIYPTIRERKLQRKDGTTFMAEINVNRFEERQSADNSARYN